MKDKIQKFVVCLTFSSLIFGCGEKNPPSQFFDLSGWKLTLPVDSLGGTGGVNGIQYPAETIQPSQLVSGYESNYFYADEMGNLVFTAPSNGAVTIPGSGSDHTRSELRELYSGPGADSSSDWTSTIGGTLSASCSVQSVSVNSDEATVGQIHNQNSAFVLLKYRPSKQDVAVSIYTTLTSGIEQSISLVSGVGLNDTITYQLTYSGNMLTTTVNGVVQSFVIDSSWAGTPMYFKLGAYQAAPNAGNPAGDQTRVTFSSFSVSH